MVLYVPGAQAAAYRPRPPLLWRVTDALPYVRRLLAVLPDGTPLAALLPPIAADAPGRALRCRAALASTLVAGLELTHHGALVLEQDAAWTPIWVRRGGDLCAGPAAYAVLARSDHAA